MTRRGLVDAVHQRHGGISRRDAQQAVDLILQIIRDRLAEGERVEIQGFGSFEIERRPGRSRRHPVTGRRLATPGSSSLIFRPSRLLEAPAAR